jgi:NAD(P)-dependent dehydrogenase (short-subunit alcohol dehydrogenase family)
MGGAAVARMQQALVVLVRRIGTAAPIVPADAMQDGVDRVIEALFRRGSASEAIRRECEGRIPLQRLATPEVIADAVLFLAP